MSGADTTTAVPKLRVVVADDHPLVRDAVARHLRRAADIEVVATVANGAEALRAVERERPDVLLLDLQIRPL